MKVKTLAKVGGVTAAGLLALNMSTYTVSEKEQAVITKFGEPVRMVLGSDKHGQEDTDRISGVKSWIDENNPEVSLSSGAGLYFKIPIVESVKKFPDTFLELDSSAKEIPTGDKKRILLDTYGRWKIDNPLQFMTTVVTTNSAISRLDDKVQSALREQVGKNDLVEIVRSSNEFLESGEDRKHDQINYGRVALMNDITNMSNSMVNEFGVSFADVRIKGADLPAANANSVYSRMQAERSRISKGYRSEGMEQATGIKATADKEKTTILADAYKQSQIIRGEGDAKATKIYAEAYSQNPELFNLMNTLNSYKTSLAADPENPTKLIMGTDSQFMKYLNGTQ